MTHNRFDVEKDLLKPLYAFLTKHNFRRSHSKSIATMLEIETDTKTVYEAFLKRKLNKDGFSATTRVTGVVKMLGLETKLSFDE